MKKIQKLFQYAVLALVSSLTFVATSPAAPSASAACAERPLLTFPAWYKGLSLDDSCNIEDFKLNDIWVIVMNIIEILIQVVAYVSTAFIIWGGFKYIKSEGDPGKISEAKAAILNAIYGLVIALASVAIVEFIQGRIAQS
jgi:hypothetical protein